MPEPRDENQFDDALPSQVRCAVSGHNQFQLPAPFVTKVGFQSARTDTAWGAKVAWFYHEEDDKAVLGNDSVDRPSLELVGTCRLSDVSNDALAAGDVNGARVTIISDLPDSLHDRLTRDTVILKPVYTVESTEVHTTYVSVYPAREYDHGDLPNVNRELREIEDENGSVQYESIDQHTNSI